MPRAADIHDDFTQWEREVAEGKRDPYFLDEQYHLHFRVNHHTFVWLLRYVERAYIVHNVDFQESPLAISFMHLCTGLIPRTRCWKSGPATDRKAILLLETSKQSTSTSRQVLQKTPILVLESRRNY